MSRERDAVIAGGIRTPFARARSDLEPLSASDLGRLALRELVERSGIAPGDLDAVATACSGMSVEDAGLARAVARGAMVPSRVPVFSVAGDDTAAFEAVAAAAHRIRVGDAELLAVVAAEDSGRTAPRRSGRDVTGFAERVETLARALGVTRDDQDALAVESHLRAAAAWQSGRLADEVVPVPLPPDFERFVERDNALQTEPSASELGELPPRYLPDFGTITDGNAAPDADGAVALLIASGRRAAELELPVLAHVRSWSCRGCETPATGLAAVLALPAALKRAGLPDLAAFDLIEWDEKLAAELLACARACASRRFCEERLGRGPLGEIEPERRNVDGGSIATGHPASAAGARQVLRLALEMAQRDVALGLATVSSVEGQGAALILDRS